MEPTIKYEGQSSEEETQQETISDKFKKYCDENPDALECRIYED